jgi:hypothetical protein
MKPLKRMLKILGIILGVFVLVIGGYVAYVFIDYSRLGDIELDIDNGTTQTINQSDVGSKEFVISSYNIGFGAYNRPYSFFMDEGYYKDEYQSEHNSTHVVGTHSQALSKDDAFTNTTGAFATIAGLQDNLGATLKPDFSLYQEVDLNSDRSYHLNQVEMGREVHSEYDMTYAVNYHSAYLAYPFNEPIGKSTSSIVTFSNYNIDKAERKEFTIAKGFSKVFDLDRCFSISEIAISGSTKKLYIFNVHMSAYDASGLIRAAQLAQLKEEIALRMDYDGEQNYVIVGGDFNHDLVVDNPRYAPLGNINWWDNYEIDGTKASWYNYFHLDESKVGTDVVNVHSGQEEPYQLDFGTEDHLNVFTGTNLPTCRDAALPLQDENENGMIDNFLISIDGFLVSDNINVNEIKTVGSGPNGSQIEDLEPTDPRYGLGFVYSDHNPVYMKFILN